MVPSVETLSVTIKRHKIKTDGSRHSSTQRFLLHRFYLCLVLNSDASISTTNIRKLSCVFIISTNVHVYIYSLLITLTCSLKAELRRAPPFVRTTLINENLTRLHMLLVPMLASLLKTGLYLPKVILVYLSAQVFNICSCEQLCNQTQFL